MVASRMYQFVFSMSKDWSAWLDYHSLDDEDADLSKSNFSVLLKQIGEAPVMKKQLSYAYAFSKSVEEKYFPDCPVAGANRSEVALKEDGKGGKHILFVMKNLQGTGLSFTIENGRSVVLAPNDVFTKKQISALHEFLKCNFIENVNFPDNLKNKDVIDE